MCEKTSQQQQLVHTVMKAMMKSKAKGKSKCPELADVASEFSDTSEEGLLGMFLGVKLLRDIAGYFSSADTSAKQKNQASRYC